MKQRKDFKPGDTIMVSGLVGPCIVTEVLTTGGHTKITYRTPEGYVYSSIASASQHQH